MSIHEVRDPPGTAVLGCVDLTPVEAVADVVAAARRERRTWSMRSLADRADLLEGAADILEPAAGELGHLLAAESGKPLAQAHFEVRGALALLRGNAQVGRRMAGHVLPTEGQHGTESDIAFTRREPLGVIAAILPFNFPVELFVEKCAAALVGGNAVVAKAPVEDPLVVERFHAAFIEAGVPAEVVALVHGDREVGSALAAAPGIDGVSLTGSTSAGVSVAGSAAPTLRRLHLELGGNNAALVLADADLDLVAEELTSGRLLMNGQACSASKRVIVDTRVHDELVDRLSVSTGRQVVGPSTDVATTVGPLISGDAARRVEAQVTRAQQEGAVLVAGTGLADGVYFAPTILASVPTDAAVAVDDEIFGPVFTLIPAVSPGDALRIANGSSFGLMASVFSADLQLAIAMAEQIEAGGVVINGTDNYRPPVIPFGGVKLSGSGREGLGYTIEELTREKTIVLRRFRGRGKELE